MSRCDHASLIYLRHDGSDTLTVSFTPQNAADFSRLFYLSDRRLCRRWTTRSPSTSYERSNSSTFYRLFPFFLFLFFSFLFFSFSFSFIFILFSTVGIIICRFHVAQYLRHYHCLPLSPFSEFSRLNLWVATTTTNLLIMFRFVWIIFVSN